jgi:hypothetical protein
MIFMSTAAPDPGREGACAGNADGRHARARRLRMEFPVLAVVLALFMLGYALWTTDRLTSLARGHIAITAPSRRIDGRVSVLAGGPAASGACLADSRGTPDPPGTRQEHEGRRPMLVPRLAACYKIAMGLAMSSMLIMMI